MNDDNISKEMYIKEIETVRDFVIEVELFSLYTELFHTDDEPKVFYRGQNNIKFCISPSIFRNNRIEHEHKIFNEMLLTCPRDFLYQNTTFEKLTKMQHYDLPTRLLDVTMNPLVSLYFACAPEVIKKDDIEDIKSELKKMNSQTINKQIIEKIITDHEQKHKTIGELFIWVSEAVSPDDYSVIINSELARCSSKTKLTENQFLKEINKYFPNIDKNDIRDSLKNPYITVVPSINNDRLKSQSGAFVLFGIPQYKENLDVGNAKSKTFDIKSTVIEQTIDYREKIILELKKPQNSSIKMSSELKDLVDNYIELTEEEKQNIHYSYIVKYKNKQAILDELEQLGINQKNLFPEIDKISEYYVDNILSKNEINMPIKSLKSIQKGTSDVEFKEEVDASEKIQNIIEESIKDIHVRAGIVNAITIYNFILNNKLFTDSDWFNFNSKIAYLELKFMDYFKKAKVSGKNMIKLTQNITEAFIKNRVVIQNFNNI